MKTVIQTFGGVMPSVDPVNLPAEAAQVARNLDLRFGDFRPVRGLGASVTTVAAAAKSVFRTPSGVWLNSTNDVDYVLGQVLDVDQERVYLTGRSAYPELWVGGTYRRLGVPTPTAPVTVTVEEVDEFTSAELAKSRAALPALVTEMFEDSLVSTLFGPIPTALPTVTTPGWLAHEAVADLPTKTALQYAFCVPMEETVLESGSIWVLKYPQEHAFLMLAELGGKRITYSGNQYWAVPLQLNGQGAVIDPVALTASLKTVMSPANPAVRLWDDGTVDAIVASALRIYDVSKEPTKGLIDGINVALTALDKVYTDAVNGKQIKDEMLAFFKRDEVEEELLDLRGDPAFDSAARKDGLYTQEVAGRCYAFGHFDASMQEGDVADTRYFNDAYDVTVAANIRADYDSCVYTDARGVTVYNRTKLRDILREEMTKLVDSRATNKWSMASVDANVEYCLGILDRVFNDGHWAQNAAWPYKLGLEKQYTAAAVSARDGMKFACDAVTERFESMRQSMISYLETTFYDELVIAYLPRVVDRISESRCYRYTYVTDLGEESAPSPPSAVFDCDQNDVVTVTATAPPPGWNIRRIRLYRSSRSDSGAAFQYVIGHSEDIADIDWLNPAQLTLVDNFRQEALGEVCPTSNYDFPPESLTGLIGMPNGVMLGFSGNTVHPCEPFTPHAFPVDYQQPMEYDFVAAGVFGQTAVILTTGHPYYASGADSASISLQKIESNQACISKRSACVGEGGVFYASPDGVCLASPSGVTVLTSGVCSREDWQALNPAASFGKYHDGVYYLFLQSGAVLCLDLNSKRISTMDIAATGAYVDLESDTLYAVVGTELLPLFAGSPLTGTWRSKVMVGSGWQFSCWKLVSRNFEAPVTVRLYGDGDLIREHTFTSRNPSRLPDGWWRDLEVEIESTGRAVSLTLATSMEELKE